MTDPQLHRSFERILLSRADLETRGDCLTPEQLLALVENRGEERARLVYLDHAMTCPHCLREFEILRVLRSGAIRLRKRKSKRHVMVAAIVSVAAVALAVFLNLPVRPPVVMLLSPVGRIAPVMPIVLRWRPVRDAAGYRTVLSDSAGRSVFTSLSLDTVAALDDSLRLVPGASYSWWVEAQMRDGTVLTSAPVRFEIARRVR